MTGLLNLPDEKMARAFPERPFSIGHDLADHPLFTLPRLIELANAMDRDRIEYNSGDLQPNQAAFDAPKVDLSVEETIRQIEHCHAWMVIKNVEHDPEYRAFLEAALAEVSGAAGRGDDLIRDIQGFIFVSSANSTTPFHIDAEENFLLQIRGDKFLHVFDNEDRTLISEQDMEISPSKHRNQEYRPEFENRAEVFEMSEGDGAFLPYMWPHWVRTGGRYSISIAVTWKSPRVQRLNKIRFMNATLRNLGLPQAGPGQSPVMDGVKVAAYDTAHLVINPLRKAEWSRRLIRQLLFGRKANYYYEA